MGSEAIPAAGHIQDLDNTQGHIFTVRPCQMGPGLAHMMVWTAQSESHVLVCYKIVLC